MPEYETVLTEYRPKAVTTRDGRSFTVHNLIDAHGNELTARQDVANLARGMLNQPVRVVTREEQKGSYLNRFLDYVGPAQGQQPVQNGAMQAQAAQQQYQPVQHQPQPPQPVPPPTPPPPPQEYLSEKDKQIHRQVAAKVAAVISKTSTEMWQNTVDLAYYFDTGQVPSRPSQQPTESYYNAPPPHDDDSVPF